MTEDELRDKIYEHAGTLTEDEVLKVEIDGYKMIVIHDNILIKLEDTWIPLNALLRILLEK